VHGEDDSRDPAAHAVICFFGAEKGINWVVRTQAFISYV